MTVFTLARRAAPRALAVAALIGLAGAARAADETPAPKALAAPTLIAPPVEQGVPCPTCQGATTVTGCKTCGRSGLGVSLFGKHQQKGPAVGHLCPGACFGYFQTQWHRWDEVCPLPYQGVGLTDAPRPAPGYVAPVPEPRTPGAPDAKPEQQPQGKPETKPDGRNGSDLPILRPNLPPMNSTPVAPPPTNPAPSIPGIPPPGGAADPTGKFGR